MNGALAAVLLGLLAVGSGCSRPRAAPGDAGSDAGDAGASEAGANASKGAGDSGGEALDAKIDEPRRLTTRRPSAGAMEARRRSVTAIASEPVLAANAELLKKQFGGAMPASIAVQSTELTEARRRGVLIGAERKDGTLENPMVLLVDDAGALVWSKERPAAGIKPPITAIAIASGPEGRFAIAVCDPPTATVALRLWDDDGSPFADFQALETKTCDALSLLYWPAHGWIIVAAGLTETRAQMVTDAGGMAWGSGRVLGARWRTAAPVSMATDSASSFVLVQYSQSPGVDREADHAVALRYDATGQPMWPAPTDLGAVRRIAPGQERITLLRTAEGVLRASLVGGLIELRSNGEIRRVP